MLEGLRRAHLVAEALNQLVFSLLDETADGSAVSCEKLSQMQSHEVPWHPQFVSVPLQETPRALNYDGAQR